jgi:hypothetical protein
MLSELELLAVMTLEKADRVYCQAPGCTKSIYKRIHVVRTQVGIEFYGSVCFDKAMGAAQSLLPHYGDWGDRVLTAEEKRQLQHNTENFLSLLKTQFEQKAAVGHPPPPHPGYTFRTNDRLR